MSNTQTAAPAIAESPLDLGRETVHRYADQGDMPAAAAAWMRALVRDAARAEGDWMKALWSGADEEVLDRLGSRAYATLTAAEDFTERMCDPTTAVRNLLDAWEDAA